MSGSPHMVTVEHMIHRLAKLNADIVTLENGLLDDGINAVGCRRHLVQADEDVFNALAHFKCLAFAIELNINALRNKGDSHD